jgi:hypothetical protein
MDMLLNGEDSIDEEDLKRLFNQLDITKDRVKRLSYGNVMKYKNQLRQ